MILTPLDIRLKKQEICHGYFVSAFIWHKLNKNFTGFIQISIFKFWNKLLKLQNAFIYIWIWRWYWNITNTWKLPFKVLAFFIWTFEQNLRNRSNLKYWHFSRNIAYMWHKTTITQACKKFKEQFFNVQLAFLLLNTSMKANFSNHVQIFQNSMTKVYESTK